MNATTSLPVAALADRLQAGDGRALACIWYRPVETQPHAVAVVAPAGGVPQQRYSAFAQWLAGRGYAVLTFDLRGIGRSHQGPLRQDNSSMRDWARWDLPAALAAAAEVAAGESTNIRLPVLWVGHSFGGNAVAFAPGVQAVDAFLLVAAGLSERRRVPWPQRGALMVAHAIWLPLLIKVFGHLPGWALGSGAQPLPAGVVRDFLRWGGLPGWIFGDADLRARDAAAQVQAPLHLWSIEDDRLHASRASVDALAARFSAAQLQRHHVRPHSLGLQRLGHFGAFNPRAGPALWQQMLQALEAAAPALQPSLVRASAGAAARYSAPP